MTSAMDLVSKWCLYLVAFLLPIFVLPIAWVTIPQAKVFLIATLILVALVAWLIARLVEGAVAIPKSALLWIGILLPIAYAVSAFVNGGAWSSFVSGSVVQDTVVIVSMWYLLLALVAILFSGDIRSTVFLLRALLVGALVLVLFQLGRLFVPSLLSLGGYLSGDSSSIFGSWHDLGIVAALLLFLSVALWNSVVADGLVYKISLGLLGVGSLLLLVVINAADVWYALAGIAIFLALTRFMHGSQQGASFGETFIRGALVWIIVAVMACAAAYWGGTLYSYLPERFQIVQLEVRPSWQGTYSIGVQTLSDTKTIAFGAGPNTFTRAWSLYKPVGVNQTDFWNVDFSAGVGLLPTAFLATGVIGLVSWLALLLALLWSGLRFFWRESSQEGTMMLGAALGAALYLAAFHIMYVPGVVLSALFFVMLGIIIALEKAAYTGVYTVVPFRAGSMVGIVSVVLGVLVAGVFAFAPITALRATASDLMVQRAAVEYGRSGTLDSTTSLIQGALRVFPQNDLAHRAAVEAGLLQLSELINADASDEAVRQQLQAELQTTIQHGLSAVSIDSADYQNWLSLAVLYQNLAGVGIEGAYENAKGAYERTISENPTNPLPRVRLAQLLIAQGDLNAALTQLNSALALKPDLAAAYFLRSQLMVSGGRLAQAIDDAANAANLTPQDPVGWYNLGTILYTAGSFDLSAQALERAISIQNNYANAIFVLGLSYDNLGRRADALQAMQVVAQLNPGDATITQVIDNLQNGRPALTPPASAEPSL